MFPLFYELDIRIDFHTEFDYDEFIKFFIIDSSFNPLQLLLLNKISTCKVPKDQFSSIEYLFIYHRCTRNQRNDIFSHTPRLCYLHCFNIIESDDDIQSKLMIKLNNLIRLKLVLYNIEFNEFEE